MVIQSIRRKRLRHLINTRFNELQSEFIAATDINQGELSSLLKDKAFGEKKARKIEKDLGLPQGWLDRSDDEPAPQLMPAHKISPEMRDKIFKLFSLLTPEQQQKYLKEIAAETQANIAIANHLKGKISLSSDNKTEKHSSPTSSR